VEIGRWILGYLEKGIQNPMAQGRSTKIIWMIKQIRTNRLSIKNSLYGGEGLVDGVEGKHLGRGKVLNKGRDLERQDMAH